MKGESSMIDIHSHILPNVDDGAQTEQESIALAKAAAKEGITKIVATPHHKNRTYDNYKSEIKYQVSVLNDLLSAHQLSRSEEHTSELQSRFDLVCRLL